MKLSIIIVSYNTQSFLDQSLASVFKHVVRPLGEKDVEVILKNKIPQEILLLKDEMTKLKDSDSGIKILNVTVSQTKTSLNQGGIEIITNSYDAILLVRLKTHFDKYKNLYYYHSSPIEIGQTFEMETGLYNITATIIKT